MPSIEDGFYFRANMTVHTISKSIKTKRSMRDVEILIRMFLDAQPDTYGHAVKKTERGDGQFDLDVGLGRISLITWVSGTEITAWRWTDGDPKLPTMEYYMHDDFDQAPEWLNRLRDVIIEEFGQFEEPSVKPRPEKPQEPPTRKDGGTVNEWLAWYEAMLDYGYACTLKEVASKGGWKYGYIRQRWSVYSAKPNLSTTNKHRTKN